MKKEYLWIVLLLVYFMFIKEAEVVYLPCESSGNVVVEIKGEVEYPGIYEVSDDTRVFSIIERAVLTTDANIIDVDMARTVIDEETIVIPSIYDFQPSLIDINTATVDELLSLPGLGETKVEAILTYREFQEFSSVEELLKVNGIGESTLENIRPFITCK